MRKIKKVENQSEQNLVIMDSEGNLRESIGNASHFMNKFLKSHYEIRRNKNPFSISYDQMHRTFGEPNIDAGNHGFTWVLKYKGNIFSINTHNQEGSQISRVFKKRKENAKHLAFDRKFSDEMEDFYNQLFEQLR